jgi:hypothetical protein
MSADSDAFALVQQLPYTPAEQQYFQAVNRGEGFYGLGWSSPPTNPVLIQQTKDLGLTGTEGAGSNNWGAIQGSGSAGSFPHLDHHANGSPYKGTFKKYLTPIEGAADSARILLKPNVRAAIAAGNLHDAVYAQHANGYFELAPESYLAAVKKNYDILTQNLNWPVLLSIPQGIIATHPLVPSGSPSLFSEEESSTSPLTPSQSEDARLSLHDRLVKYGF